MANPRDRAPLPFNRNADSLRLGFRYPEEPTDERPVLVWAPFWADDSERLAYEDAVHQHPHKPGEGAMTYMARISAIVTGQYKQAGLSMPRVRISQVEWQRRQNDVKRRAANDWDAEDWRGGQP